MTVAQTTEAIILTPPRLRSGLNGLVRCGQALMNCYWTSPTYWNFVTRSELRIISSSGVRFSRKRLTYRGRLASPRRIAERTIRLQTAWQTELPARQWDYGATGRREGRGYSTLIASNPQPG